MKPCKPEQTDAGEIEGCEDCGFSDCRTCGRTIRRCGTVGSDGCEFCTPFPEIECQRCEGTGMVADGPLVDTDCPDCTK